MIRLRKLNIVKEVASELAARKLEEHGFQRIIVEQKEKSDEAEREEKSEKGKKVSKKEAGGKEDDAGGSGTDNACGTDEADNI